MKAQNILTIALAAATVVLFAKNKSMERDIELLRSSISSDRVQLENRINFIYSNVDNMMKEQASLFSQFSYSLDNLSTADNSATLSISAMPKAVSDSMTACVTFDGKTYEMTKNGQNPLYAEIPVDIFRYYKEKPLISITIGEITQNEYAKDIRLDSIWENFLPQINHADFSLNEAFYNPGDVMVQGTFSVRVDDQKQNSGIYFKKYHLITEINGKQTDSRDITQEISQNSDPKLKICHMSFKETYNLRKNDMLILYISGEDSAGYTHKKEVFSHTHTIGDSKPVPEHMAYPVGFNGEYIYDKDGNLLYGTEPEIK